MFSTYIWNDCLLVADIVSFGKMLLFSEELQVNAALTLLETFVLLWTAAFPQYSFTQLFLRAFGVNLAIQLFWDMVIYPHLVNPLRHLPRVKV